MVGWAESRGEGFFRDGQERSGIKAFPGGQKPWMLQTPIFLFPTHGAMGREQSRVVLGYFSQLCISDCLKPREMSVCYISLSSWAKFGCLPIPYLCCYWFRLG